MKKPDQHLINKWSSIKDPQFSTCKYWSSSDLTMSYRYDGGLQNLKSK